MAVRTKSDPSAFVGKVFLAFSHDYSFKYCLWLLSCYNDRGVVTTELLWTTMLKIFPNLPFTKNIPISALEE